MNRCSFARRSTTVAAGIAIALAAAGAAQAGTATVRFVDPDNFRDAAPSRQFASAEDREALRVDLERHLQQLAERRLPADQRLQVDVLDLDLAGDFEPWRTRGQDIRIVRDIAWPRMTLRYTLTRGDQVIASRAEEKISDMNFLVGINRYSSSDRLRYEKAMLDRWFDSSFK